MPVRLVFFFSGRSCPRSRSCGLEMGALRVYQTLPKSFPLTVAGTSPQDAQERHSSSWLSHPQACKCPCPSRRSGYARIAPFAVVNQARARSRLPVFARATGSCAWLLPCTGLVPRRRPPQQQIRAGEKRAWQERFPSTLPLLRPAPRQHGQPTSSVRDAARNHVARAPPLRWASNRVQGTSCSSSHRIQMFVKNHCKQIRCTILFSFFSSTLTCADERDQARIIDKLEFKPEG